MRNSTIKLSLAVAFALCMQNYAFADNANQSINTSDSSIANIANRGGAEQGF